MLIETTYNNGTAIYSLTENGKEISQICITDGKYTGYSIVPIITNLNGKSTGILVILNWIISKLKSPLLADLKFSILLDYGFRHHETGLVWDNNFEDAEELMAVSS
ncbi:hypothetical protein [Bacillus sp. FJAT-29937]|uniref:hypothetical protein n=1 Tax=Bacillus sp. FJAT-29937 TaxID=1720553 RepID=UPI00082F3455|nr:hypothetical protein [Bacillus sp. FJAT-29937]